MSVWETVTWAVARAGGLTAYVLLTAAVVMGLALSLRWQSARWPRLINNEWHNYLTLLSLIFVGVHVLAVWVDPFTHFGLTEIWIPLASTYRPQWLAFGIVGLYLGLAIGISTWLRPIIGYQLWRHLHVLTLVLYALVTVHGIGTGSDTSSWWALGIYIVSIGIVGTLVVVRLLGTDSGTGQQRTHTPAQHRPTTPASPESRVLVPPRGYCDPQ